MGLVPGAGDHGSRWGASSMIHRCAVVAVGVAPCGVLWWPLRHGVNRGWASHPLEWEGTGHGPSAQRWGSRWSLRCIAGGSRRCAVVAVGAAPR